MDTATLTRRTTEYEEKRIAVGDGLFIEARDYAPTLPETGLPVICLHGLTRNVRDFETVAPRIAALGRRVVALSMRGRGLSDRDPDPAHYAPPVYVQDVATALDALEIIEAVFVGTSMGGVITMLMAAGEEGQRIRAAVLNDIGPVLDPRGLARIAGYVGRGGPVADWNAAAAAIKSINGEAFPTRLHDDAFWMRFARRTFRETGAGRIEPDYDPMIALAFSDPPAEPADLSALFETLAQRPVLVLRGALSDLLSPDGIAHMRAIMSDLVAVEIPDVGHAPTLEEPESWDSLLDFLARIP